jgi:hypothetical protein
MLLPAGLQFRREPMRRARDGGGRFVGVGR